jgi:hypothetical protein
MRRKGSIKYSEAEGAWLKFPPTANAREEPEKRVQDATREMTAKKSKGRKRTDQPRADKTRLSKQIIPKTGKPRAKATI